MEELLKNPKLFPIVVSLMIFAFVKDKFKDDINGFFSKRTANLREIDVLTKEMNGQNDIYIQNHLKSEIYRRAFKINLTGHKLSRFLGDWGGSGIDLSEVSEIVDLLDFSSGVVRLRDYPRFQEYMTCGISTIFALTGMVIAIFLPTSRSLFILAINLFGFLLIGFGLWGVGTFLKRQFLHKKYQAIMGTNISSQRSP
jgi:hypothetical protein